MGLLAAVTYNQMVVREAPRSPELDGVFHALSDATRRDIVVTVLERGYSVSSLAERYPMSFAAVQKHVAVLERAGLVQKERRGKEQIVTGNVDALRRARELLDRLEAIWRRRVDVMGEILAETPTPATPAPAPPAPPRGPQP